MKALPLLTASLAGLITLTGCYLVPIRSNDAIDPALIGKWKGPPLVQFTGQPEEEIVATFKKASATTYDLTTDQGHVLKAHVAVIKGRQFLCVFNAAANTKKPGDTPWAIFAYSVQTVKPIFGRPVIQAKLSPLNNNVIPKTIASSSQLRSAVEAHLNNPKLVMPALTYKKLAF